jgi:hypothetical protein
MTRTQERKALAATRRALRSVEKALAPLREAMEQAARSDDPAVVAELGHLRDLSRKGYL